MMLNFQHHLHFELRIKDLQESCNRKFQQNKQLHQSNNIE